jgi:3-hydroxyisobutyrate dehydrogenase-like beta-hydroxyacid dehydrogenase
MTGPTIAIVAPGDMGAGIGAALHAAGRDVITTLEGRSDATRARAERARLRDAGSLDDVVAAADLFVSILPPASALALARDVAAAIARTGKRPVYLDGNAVSPATVAGVADIVTEAGGAFIDGGIVGLAPGKSAQPTRFYVSGDDLAPAQALTVDGIVVKEVSGGVGRASALKMLYAGINKARFSLFALVATAAERLDLLDELGEEMTFSQADTWAYMERMIPRLPADSERWAPELEEIGRTMDAAGVSGDMHRGAAWILRLMATTPFAAETRETIDSSRSMEDTLRVFVEHMK